MNTDRPFLPKLLVTPLYLAVIENSSENQFLSETSPMIFQVSDGDLLLVFSQARFLAQFFETSQSFVEMAPQAILTLAKERGLKIGFDLGEDHGAILEENVIDAVLSYLSDAERLEDVNSLHLVEFAQDELVVGKLEALIPQENVAYLVKDVDHGLILIMLGAGEIENLSDMRAGLMNMEIEASIGFLYFPNNHALWLRIEDAVKKYGRLLEARPEKKEVKIPNLRY